jgi:hypothetical protein
VVFFVDKIRVLRYYFCIHLVGDKRVQAADSTLNNNYIWSLYTTCNLGLQKFVDSQPEIGQSLIDFYQDLMKLGLEIQKITLDLLYQTDKYQIYIQVKTKSLASEAQEKYNQLQFQLHSSLLPIFVQL